MSTTASNKVDATSKNPFDTSDPFDGGRGTPSIEASVGKGGDKIHIRLQQRNGRKTVTTVQGVPEKYDPKKLLKAMKKEFACNGHVASSADSSDEDSPGPNKTGQEFGRILQFSGDQRTKVKEFLVDCGLVTEKEAKDLIVIHGY
ncbi:translation initiation factor SUI1-domain-containing protein [Kockovaella imperatae]|uniref:Translation initiation factor SUI1-domain-containing protein n=1 Tax=Kockovaella imperatae TaxID=4999 RepID=A0A1Y1U8I7_9TREE|nr:translation initiation factor SUI1-domain-containing protein [Kockovaella imperatae]ORX33854.1 translation initiation factor SUI1-domain-containing protein [Kockovaella imperatae]